MRTRSGHRPRNRGVALLTVLVIITLLTLLILSFLAITQSEHREAAGFAESQKAKMAAQSSLAHAIATLRANIPDPALLETNAETANTKNWAINPGRLTLIDSEGAIEHVPLHSGITEESPEATRDPNVHSFDLNEPIHGTAVPTITYAFDSSGKADPLADSPPMRVKWVNLLSDPSKEASESNPIISRHAFWIDDESGKLNYNTAVGKPSREDDTTEFYRQYELGMLPPLFQPGEGNGSVGDIASNRKWGLGSPRSTNLDVLFDSPADIDIRSLLENNYYRGFSRHPEGILEHLTLSESKKSTWFQENRYQLTFYSKSPEFNAFGKPRLMLSNIPLSLEGGPNYQLPFVYNGPDAPDTLQEMKGVLHLSSLLGSMGFTGNVYDGQNLGAVDSGNIVNRAQLEMLMRYFRRVFPGYEDSFVDKYGEEECAQMALGMLLMARLATTTMREKTRDLPAAIRNNPKKNLPFELLKGFSDDFALRTTSVSYSPHAKERRNHNPERHYWRFQPGSGSDPGHFLSRDEDSDDSTIPMLPQTPGPHITEVRLVFRSFPAREKPTPIPEEQLYKDFPIARGKIIPGKKWLGFRFEVEYYSHPVAPKVRLRNFPYKTDYLRLDLSGTSSFIQELGPPDPKVAPQRADRNWNYNKLRRDNRFDGNGDPLFNENGSRRKRTITDRKSLGSLIVRPNVVIFPEAKHPQMNRIIANGPWQLVGRDRRWLGNITDRKPSQNDIPRVFDAISTIKIDVKFRGGMSVSPGGGRPRQMIPIGEKVTDVLEGNTTIRMNASETPSLSWQIEDPRLSGHKEQWWYEEKPDSSAGTPGDINTNTNKPDQFEPDNDSTEKSKFRYFQRGYGKVAGLNVMRYDEYDSRSRISSKGYWSMLHTGIQSEEPWRTLSLNRPAEAEADPPDWLLMDLLGNSFAMQRGQWKKNSSLPDEFSTISYMHSTTGAINLNTKTYPDNSPYFSAPQRRKPIEAVFKHLRTDEQIDKLIDSIEAHQAGSHFTYVGELAEMEGYGRDSADALEFENEELLRNMIGCLTTKSNTFGVWGVGQTVRKTRDNTKWDAFEDGDFVEGEKRYFAIVERYIWPGIDGVPGNAHLNSSGHWDRTASPKTNIPVDGELTDRLFQLPGSPPLKMRADSTRLVLNQKGTYPEFDGPQKVEMDLYASKALGKVVWSSSPLEEAYNPPQPVIKYRVVYFRYLDE